MAVLRDGDRASARVAPAAAKQATAEERAGATYPADGVTNVEPVAAPRSSSEAAQVLGSSVHGARSRSRPSFVEGRNGQTVKDGLLVRG
jgi:hypothetical protein